MQNHKLAGKDIPKAWKATFPQYKGRTFSLRVSETVDMGNGYWSGGSRSTYRAVNLQTGAIENASTVLRNPFAGGADPALCAVPLNPAYVVVEHVVFCGKDMGLRFHVHPAAMQNLSCLNVNALATIR